MTTLAITPNWKNKSAKFNGTVAAGEHVSVTIQNDNGEGGEFIDDASTLRLRVVDPCDGRTLAVFPEPVPEGETPEEWDSDLSPLRCTLNLNTIQMLKAVPPAANVPLLFVLDDYENKTLYFKETFPVEHWPRLRGEEEPTNLDDYKDIIADFNTRLDGYDSRITAAESVANAATENASAASSTAEQAKGIANQAVGKAEEAKSTANAVANNLEQNYYTADETNEAIDRVAAYYITYDAAGNPFPTYAALANAQTVYSGGEVRMPTRNDYCVVLADETHQGAEYRYIYAVAEGETTGEWQPQFPVEGVITFDNTVTPSSTNGVKSSGIWSALWGALTALPTGFSSLYDWCVSQLAGKMASTATGADIAVSGTDATKISAALAGKLNNTTDTMSGSLTIQGSLTVGSRASGSTIGTNSTAEGAGTTASGHYSHAEGAGATASGLCSHAEGVGTMAQNEAEHAQGRFNVSHKASDFGEDAGNTLSSIGFGHRDNTRKNAVETMQDGKTFIYGLGGYDGTNPTATGVKDLATAVNGKLASTSAAPAFSSNSSVSYPVGSHVTYNGKLYKCTTATTGGTWVVGSWAEDTMTDPDATLDITAQNQLRAVAKDGTVLWAQGYDLASTSSATLACDACNNFTFADGATTQAFTLPTAPTGKVGDFGLDIDNSANTSAATMTLTGLDTAFSVVVPEGESLTDMLAIAAGELAQFYVTLTTFRVNNLPTWHIVKQVVENGGATV